MEAKELMIGDLIRYRQDQCLTDEDKAPLTVTCVGEPEYPDYMPFVKIKGSNEKYHQDLFEPIPLTAAIILKLGIKRAGYDKYFVGNNKYIKYYEHNDTFAIGLMIDAYDEPQFQPFASVNFVHELQHLVGLNEVADNLKV